LGALKNEAMKTPARKLNKTNKKAFELDIKKKICYYLNKITTVN